MSKCRYPDWEGGMEVERRICRCGKTATKQTTNGAYQERIGGLPQNHGYYCDECFAEGLRIETEAFEQ